MRLSRLKRNNHDVWTIGWKWFSVMNQESALAKAMIQEILSGAIQIKHIKMTALIKQVNFPNHSWYRVRYHLKDMEGCQSLS